MKIVVPVEADKQSMIKRTGQASYFAIFENDKLNSFIPNSHTDEEHDHHNLNDQEHVNEHKKDVINLQGCDVILVQAIGKHMRAALDDIGLKIVKIKPNTNNVFEIVKDFLTKN